MSEKEFYIEGTIKEVIFRRGIVTFTLTPTDEFVVNCKDSGNRKLLFIETGSEGEKKLPTNAAVLMGADVEFSLSRLSYAVCNCSQLLCMFKREHARLRIHVIAPDVSAGGSSSGKALDVVSLTVL